MNTIKQKLIRRLKIIEGQTRGIQEMLSKDAYCIDVITQISAVKQALSGIDNILMENHLNTCASDQIQKGKSKKVTEEILKVYKLAQR